MKSLRYELATRELGLALIQVVEMWSSPKYDSFLKSSEPGELAAAWFKKFAGEWKVARNIKDGYQTHVRKYLNRHFRRAAAVCEDGGSVDAAARYPQQRGWSHGTPVSLVSKIGFFLRPQRFVPLDKFSVDGLNQLLNSSGAEKVKRKPYKPYLSAFDKLYIRFEPQLRDALNERWVLGMANKLGCRRAALASDAMRRKLCDAYLMYIAEYRK